MEEGRVGVLDDQGQGAFALCFCDWPVRLGSPGSMAGGVGV